MEVYFTILLFIFGAIMGSFYNVVGYRLPRGESIAFPPSHCTKCNHRLSALELIPIFSFLFQICSDCVFQISFTAKSKPFPEACVPLHNTSILFCLTAIFSLHSVISVHSNFIQHHRHYSQTFKSNRTILARFP